MPKGEEEFARRSRLLKRVGEQIKQQGAKAQGSSKTFRFSRDIAKDRGRVRLEELKSQRLEENLRKIAKRKNVSPDVAKRALRGAGRSLKERTESRKAIAKELKRIKKLKGLKTSRVMRIGKRIGDLLKRQGILKKTFPPIRKGGGIIVPKSLLRKRFGEKPGA